MHVRGSGDIIGLSNGQLFDFVANAISSSVLLANEDFTTLEASGFNSETSGRTLGSPADLVFFQAAPVSIQVSAIVDPNESGGFTDGIEVTPLPTIRRHNISGNLTLVYEYEPATTNPIPEPTSIVLWGMSGLGLLSLRKRKSTRAGNRC